jgi:hypothetical protein
MTSLNVDYASSIYTLNKQVNAGNQILSFRPSLKVDLRAHDFFKISIDKEWTLKNPVWTSYARLGTENPYNSTAFAENPHQFSWVVTPKDETYKTP